MRPYILKTTLLALPLAGLLAFTSTAFAHDDDDDYDRPHARVHHDLNQEHEEVHDSLGAQHDAAHEYSMTRRQHRALHRALKQEHGDAHSDLRDQHEDYHDQSYGQGWYGNYGHGYHQGGYRHRWR